MKLASDLRLTSAFGYPQYTNYVPAFSGCLDYIYFKESTRLRLKRVLPLATHTRVVEHTALPNVNFPSDHLPLVCEFEHE